MTVTSKPPEHITTNKFKGKYRVPSARLQNYDYGQNGAYFVTICTKNREHYFGNIVETRFIASPYQMQYSDLGDIAQKCWLEMPNHFPFVGLGECVVMPNHVHGIIMIDKIDRRDAIYRVSKPIKDAINRVSTGNIVNLGGVARNHNPMLYKNLSTVVRWYKGRVTFECRKNDSNFFWQSRFYDHVVRNEDELYRVSEYIMLNPENWEDDDYF